MTRDLHPGWQAGPMRVVPVPDEPRMVYLSDERRGHQNGSILTHAQAEALAASILEAVPIADEHREALDAAIAEAESRDMMVPLGLQTQEGLPGRPESFTGIREVSHKTALEAFDESVGHPLREAILAGFAEHRDADRLLRESQEVEAMARRFARALRRGR